MADIFRHTAPKLVRRLERNRSAYQTFKQDMQALRNVSSPADAGFTELFDFFTLADYMYQIGDWNAFLGILNHSDPEKRSGIVSVLCSMVTAVDTLDAIMQDAEKYTGPVACSLRGTFEPRFFRSF